MNDEVKPGSQLALELDQRELMTRKEALHYIADALKCSFYTARDMYWPVLQKKAKPVGWNKRKNRPALLRVFRDDCDKIIRDAKLNLYSSTKY